MPAFDAAYWDERYRDKETVWGLAPNRFVEQEVGDLSPGRALDLACGEGRNAIWLAARGWTVVAVDFSAVAIDKGRAGAAQLDEPDRIEWHVADATTFEADAPVDLAVLCYFQVPPPARRAAVSRAVASARARGNAARRRARFPQPDRRDGRAAGSERAVHRGRRRRRSRRVGPRHRQGAARCSARSTARHGLPSTPWSVLTGPR